MFQYWNNALFAHLHYSLQITSHYGQKHSLSCIIWLMMMWKALNDSSQKLPNWNRRKNFSTLLIHEQKKRIPNYLFHLRARKKKRREKPHFSFQFSNSSRNKLNILQIFFRRSNPKQTRTEVRTEGFYTIFIFFSHFGIINCLKTNGEKARSEILFKPCNCDFSDSEWRNSNWDEIFIMILLLQLQEER
jgi:DNA replication protein DnaD